MTKSLLAGAALAVATLAQPASADPINVVAAENFYGDIAQQIGGDNVVVTSVRRRRGHYERRLVAPLWVRHRGLTRRWPHFRYGR